MNQLDRARQARSIIESTTPTVFHVAYFGGALAAAMISRALELNEMRQFFVLYLICAVGIGIVWWCLREIPKRQRAGDDLRTLYPQLTSSRKVFRDTEAIISEERTRVISLLKDALLPSEVKEYSGRFLDGGRFEMYHGKVSPMSKAHKIAEIVGQLSREHNLSLRVSFVRRMFDTTPCVHVFVLGENMYLG